MEILKKAENSGYPFFWFNYTEYWCVDIDNRCMWNVLRPWLKMQVKYCWDESMYGCYKMVEFEEKQRRLSRELVALGF